LEWRESQFARKGRIMAARKYVISFIIFSSTNPVPGDVWVCVNGKMIPVENIPGMGEGIKDNDGRVNSSMVYLTYCNNFCKCHRVQQ
jgi:hypothetical protein